VEEVNKDGIGTEGADRRRSLCNNLPFAGLMQWGYIRVEARMLAETFGTVWDVYQHQTRRWI
jgi:hypothetical protein